MRTKLHYALANFFESMAGNTMNKFIRTIHQAGGVFYVTKKDLISSPQRTSQVVIEIDNQTIVFHHDSPTKAVYTKHVFKQLNELLEVHLATVENYPQALIDAQSTKNHPFEISKALVNNSRSADLGYPAHTLLFHDPIILQSDPRPDMQTARGRLKYAAGIRLWYTRFPIAFAQWYSELKSHEKQEFVQIKNPMGEGIAKTANASQYASASLHYLIKHLNNHPRGKQIATNWHQFIVDADDLHTDDSDFFRSQYPQDLIGHIYPQSALETTNMHGGFIAKKVSQGRDFGILGARYCKVTGRHQTVAIVPRQSELAHELGEYMLDNDYIDMYNADLPPSHKDMYDINKAAIEPTKFFLCMQKQYSVSPSDEQNKTPAPAWWKQFRRGDFFHPLPAPLVVAMPEYFVLFEHTDCTPNGKPVSTHTVKVRKLPIGELDMLKDVIGQDTQPAQTSDEITDIAHTVVEPTGFEAALQAADEQMQHHEEESFGVQASAPDTTHDQPEEELDEKPKQDPLTGLKIDVSAALRLLRCQAFDHDIVKDWIGEMYNALAEAGVISPEYNPMCFAMRSHNCDMSVAAPSLPSTGLEITASKGFGFNIAHVDIDEHKRRYLVSIALDFHFKNFSKESIADLVPVEYAAGVDVEHNGVDITTAQQTISNVIDKVTQVFINNNNCAFRKDGRSFLPHAQKTFMMEVFGPSRAQMFMVATLSIQASVETFTRVDIS